MSDAANFITLSDPDQFSSLFIGLRPLPLYIGLRSDASPNTPICLDMPVPTFPTYIFLDLISLTTPYFDTFLVCIFYIWVILVSNTSLGFLSDKQGMLNVDTYCLLIQLLEFDWFYADILVARDMF